jgi:Fic family protein
MTKWVANQPYNQLPPLPPAHFVPSDQVQRAVTAAHIAIARVEQALALLPSPQIFVTAIPIVESQASSAIENIVTTNDQLFAQLVGQQAPFTDKKIQSVWANRGALKVGFAKVTSRPITANLAAELCGILLGHQVEIRNAPGTFIGALGKATYTPPVGSSLIAQKLADWESFVNSDSDLDPLIVMAMAHYQFEAIHPFYDGNGRTGRILNALLLAQKRVISAPVLHLSRSINRNRQAYYDSLLAVTSIGDWERWLVFMLDVVHESATEALSQVIKIATLRADAFELIAGSKLKLDVHERLADLIFETPYFRQPDLARTFGVSRPTSASWSETLEKLGLVVGVTSGRDKYYVNQAMMDVLA